tara:strand:- start:147 stop:482 length:336 start_codon:yes stop_codon:yes gene_type:complete
MPAKSDEIARRETVAREHIRAVYGTLDDEFGATLFVSHHLDEIEAAYWTKQLATSKPEPMQVLNMLVLRSHWGGDDEIERFDFALPDEITSYVICVAFNDSGDVANISMES